LPSNLFQNKFCFALKATNLTLTFSLKKIEFIINTFATKKAYSCAKIISMKKLFLFVILLFSIYSNGQTYIKANAITALIAIPNIGIETSIGKKSTFQFDVLASFWKSINGNPYQFYTFTPEYRYHFREKFNGFYAGAHIAYDIYNITKWNYIDLGVHEIGIGYEMGATIGYEKKINDKFLLDVFLGGGHHQGFYHSYYIETGKRWEQDKAVGYNKSGEWLPYRGGIMISYRIN
jgi:hypothetical protein